MDDNTPVTPNAAPLEASPTWVRAAQAAVIGVVAGLALNAVLSMAVSGESLVDQQPKPQQKQCNKKAQPKHDTATPKPEAPAMSEVTWSIDGFVVLAAPAATTSSAFASDAGFEHAHGLSDLREAIPGN